MTNRLSIRVSPALRKQIAAVMKKTGRTQTEVARDALEKYCQQELVTKSAYGIFSWRLGSSETRKAFRLISAPIQSTWKALDVTEAPKYHHVLLDTGPFVAMRNPQDSQHVRCIETLQVIQAPLLTCWPVITEAAWMLRHNAVLVRRIFTTIARGSVAILDIPAEEIDQIDALYARYADLSPQLADIALLHLAQRENLENVFTLDRRDFGVFRLKGNKRFRIVPEDK